MYLPLPPHTMVGSRFISDRAFARIIGVLSHGDVHSLVLANLVFVSKHFLQHGLFEECTPADNRSASTQRLKYQFFMWA